MLLLSLILVLHLSSIIHMAESISTPSTWSIEYPFPSLSTPATATTSDSSGVSKSINDRRTTIWPNYPNQQQQQLFPSWNGIRQQKRQPLPGLFDFHPLDTSTIVEHQAAPQMTPTAYDYTSTSLHNSAANNRSLTATQLNLIDLLARFYSTSSPRTSGSGAAAGAVVDLDRSDTRYRRPKHSKKSSADKYRLSTSRHLADKFESAPLGVHFDDQPLDQSVAAFEANEKELDQSDVNSQGNRDIVAIWYDSPPQASNLISESKNSKPTRSDQSQTKLFDNLFSSSKYSSIAAHQMQPAAYYSFPMPMVDHHHHKVMPRKGLLEKSLILSILVGIGAGLLSFLLISNLFLSIPLLALAILQFFSGQMNMIMPNNNNNNNNMPMSMPTQQPSQSNNNQVGKRRKKRSINLIASPPFELTIQNALDKASQIYQ